MIATRKYFIGFVALALTVSTRAAEPDRYLPADTDQVIVFNIKQMMGSALVKKHLLPEIEKQLKDNKDFKQMQEATGLDLLKDVHSVVVSNTGTKGDKVSFIIRGKFDLEKIEKTAKSIAADKKDLKISKLGDRPLYEADNKDGKTTYFTFIDGTTLIGSLSKDVLTTAVDGKGGKLNKELAEALKSVDGKQSIFMAGVIPEDAKAALGAIQQGPVEALKKVSAVSGGINITSDVTVTISLATGDPAAAKELKEFGEMAKGIIAFAAQNNEQIKPFADELLKTLKFQTNKGDVSVSFKASEEIIQKLLEMIPKN